MKNWKNKCEYIKIRFKTEYTDEKNYKTGTYNGKTVDKESEDIVYFDDTHEYIDKESGVRGISVTTLIHRYSNPFDADF